MPAAAQPEAPERRPAILAVDDEPAAGLAHELNNPAAAARRSAAEMAEMIEVIRAAMARFVVDRHNGSLSVQSAPGHTAFLVRLALP